jgi:hypothetical protein
VQHAAVRAALVDGEVLHQAAVRSDELGADTPRPTTDILATDLRDVALHLAHHRGDHLIAPHLADPDAEVAACQLPGAAEAQRVGEVMQRRAPGCPALASQGEHRVRSDPDLAIDTTGEVDAEERQASTGRDRVDVASYQVATIGSQAQPRAPEGHDPRCRAVAGHGGDPVGAESGTGDDHAGGQLAGVGSWVVVPAGVLAFAADREVDDLTPLLDVDHLGVGPHLAASVADRGGQRPAHGAEIGHGGLRCPQTGDAAHVGLVLAEAVGIEPVDLDAVGASALRRAAPGPAARRGPPRRRACRCARRGRRARHRSAP